MHQQTQNRIIITVDGLAASGKSAVSKLLAERLGYIHFSSGALYRAAGFLVQQEDGDSNDPSKVLEILKRYHLTFSSSGTECRVLIDGKDLAGLLYSPEVSETTSIISAHLKVREHLLPLQRKCFPNRNLVAEGRDMGTVVFPAAQLKFFIMASPQVRIERRLAQFAKGAASIQELNSLKAKIEIEINERDKRDSERAASPTTAASDAVIIDNSSETLTEIVEKMYYLVSERGLPIGSK